MAQELLKKQIGRRILREANDLKRTIGSLASEIGLQKEMLEKLLNDFSIQHIRKSSSLTLSGGERRRTEIARALIMNPDFILLDEPFSGIDPIAVEDIQKIIRKLKENNIGILITDHNVRETLNITDRAYLLYEGKVLKEGTAKELISDEEVKRLYLGNTFVEKNNNE